MSETIQQTADRLTAFISQNYTDVETGPGSVLSELLIKLAATVQNEQYNLVETLAASNTIQAALLATEDTYSEAIDLLASNYNTYRNPGQRVVGRLKVTTTYAYDTTIPLQTVFVQPALNLKYTLANGVRVSTNPSGTNDVQLYAVSGLYYFILDVIAENPGEVYQVSSGTVFDLDADSTLSGFVRAEAYGSFSSGRAVETDKQLIAKIKSNLGNTRFESSAGIARRFAQEFPNFQALSVVGANDSEMLRDKSNPLGIATFGKADVYVRSGLGLTSSMFTKTATKIGSTTWELFITNTDAPGFYNVASIIPVTSAFDLTGTLVPTSTTYDYALYPGQRNNEVVSATTARFTKYQTARITFTYEDSPNAAIGSQFEFEIHVNRQPDLTAMQDLLLLDDTRLACADYLVKAVVPCLVSLDISLIKRRATDTYESLNLAKLKQDLFTYINSIPFGGELHASNLVDICHNYDIKRVDLPLTMTGNILCPDGTTTTIVNSDVLTIPNLPTKGVTPKTTGYFIEYYRGADSPIDNIGLTLS